MNIEELHKLAMDSGLESTVIERIFNMCCPDHEENFGEMELTAESTDPNFCPNCGVMFLYDVVNEGEDQKKEDAGHPVKIEILKKENGLPYFRIVARNGNILCHSETYVDSRGPLNTINSMIEDIKASNYEIVNLTKEK